MYLILYTILFKNINRFNAFSVVLISYDTGILIKSSSIHENISKSTKKEDANSEDVFYDCNENKFEYFSDKSDSLVKLGAPLTCRDRKFSTILSDGINRLIEHVILKSVDFSGNEESKEKLINERKEAAKKNLNLLMKIIKKYKEIEIDKESTITGETKIVNNRKNYTTPLKNDPNIGEYKPEGDEVIDVNQRESNTGKKKSLIIVAACLYIISTLAYLLLRTCGKMGIDSILRIYVLISFYLAMYIFFFN